MSKLILTEWSPLRADTGFIMEDKSANNGRLVLKGPMQRAKKENQNKRIYPMDLLQREFSNYDKPIREGRALGELDHPDNSTVSLEKASHVVREQWWDGDTWMGRIEILSTPCGKILENLLESGVVVGISSRGIGSTSKNESGADIVQDDFQLVCFDMVAEPSTHGAFMLPESVDRSRLASRPDRIFRALNALKGNK
jgi:hypothetical protein